MVSTACSLGLGRVSVCVCGGGPSGSKGAHGGAYLRMGKVTMTTSFLYIRCKGSAQRFSVRS